MLKLTEISKIILLFTIKPAILLRRKIRRLKSRKITNQNNAVFTKIFKRLIPSPVLLDLEEFGGKFEMDFRSDIFRRFALEGSYEQNIIEVVNKYVQPEKDAIDVGANIGLFTVLLSHLVNEDRKVLSIEPTPNAFKLLESNIIRNNCENKIILFNGIISENNGFANLNTIQGGEEYSSIGTISSGYVRERQVTTIKVISTTLDGLVQSNRINPGFIKIDTEGAEYLVLKGSIETMMNYRPIILSEISDKFLQTLNNSSKQVIDLLADYNYRIINLSKPHAKIVMPFTGEILAIPREFV